MGASAGDSVAPACTLGTSAAAQLCSGGSTAAQPACAALRPGQQQHVAMPLSACASGPSMCWRLAVAVRLESK